MSDCELRNCNMIRLVCMALIPLIIGGCSSQPSKVVSSGKPILKLQSEDSQDFGVVNPSDEILFANFKFQNSGDSALIIDGILPSCTCAKAVVRPSRIEPGMFGDIILSLDTKKLGPQTATVAIYSNCSQTPVTKVRAEWHPRNDLFANPSQYPILTIAAGTEVESQVELDTVLPSIDGEELKAESRIDKPVQGLSHAACIVGKYCHVKVTAAKLTKTGLYFGEVLVTKSDFDVPLCIKWYADVIAPITLSPESISFIPNGFGEWSSQLIVDALAKSDLIGLTVDSGDPSKDNCKIKFVKTMIDEDSCILDITVTKEQLKRTESLVIRLSSDRMFQIPILPCDF